MSEGLGQHCTLVRGVNFQNGDARRKGEEGYVPVLRAGNISKTLDLKNDLVWVPNRLVSEEQQLRIGDIAICLSSGSADVVGKTARLDENWHGTVGAFCGIVRPDSNVNSEYLAHWFRSPQFWKWRDCQARGGSIQNLRFSELAVLDVSFPSLEEQRRIAARLREQLSILAKAREALEAQLAAAESLPAAHLRVVFQSADAEQWPRAALGELCDIVANQVSPTDAAFADLAHVSGENIETGTLQLINIRSARQDRMTSGKYLFEQGDVLYSKLRPYLRKVAIAPSRGLCSADMYPLRVRADRMDAKYAAWLLLSDEFTKYAISESQRSRMPKLNRDQLFAWKAPIPPLEKQRALAAQLDAEFAEAGALRQTIAAKLAELEKLPAALLRKAFSPAARSTENLTYT